MGVRAEFIIPEGQGQASQYIRTVNELQIKINENQFTLKVALQIVSFLDL